VPVAGTSQRKYINLFYLLTLPLGGGGWGGGGGEVPHYVHSNMGLDTGPTRCWVVWFEEVTLLGDSGQTLIMLPGEPWDSHGSSFVNISGDAGKHRIYLFARGYDLLGYDARGFTQYSTSHMEGYALL
jgi:hypothetical protein